MSGVRIPPGAFSVHRRLEGNDKQMNIEKLAEDAFRDLHDNNSRGDQESNNRNVIKEVVRDAHLIGVIDGLIAFAWSKDGVEYVGSCGTTLKDAIEMAKKGKLVMIRKINNDY